MAYPSDVILRRVTIAGNVLENDDPLLFRGTITASRALVHRSDGREYMNAGVSVQSVDVGLQAETVLPCTDLDVWGDGLGGAIDVTNGKQSHVYSIAGAWYNAQGNVVAQLKKFTFILAQGDGSDVSLGQLVPATSAGGATILIPDEWSAQVAAAQAAAADAAASAGATDSGVQGLITDTSSQTRTALNAAFVAGNAHPNDAPAFALYFPEAHGAQGDGTTDDTAAVQAAWQAAYNNGGGTVYFEAKTYLINGQLVAPNNGASIPKQPPTTFKGCGSQWDGTWQNNGASLGATILDMRSTTGPAKIDTRGTGSFKIKSLVLTQNGSATDTNPFVQTTNTTLFAEDVSVYGYSTLLHATCVQDAFVLGGTTITVGNAANAPFQGYGTVIEKCYFGRIRRGVYGRSWCNGVQVINNTWSASCGADNTAAAIQFDGSLIAGSMAMGNRLSGNTVELTGYVYGARFTNSVGNICQGNSWWDNGASTLAPYLFEGPSSNSGGHIIDDLFPNTAAGSEVIANNLTYNMRTNGWYLGNGHHGSNPWIMQPRLATGNEGTILMQVLRSSAEATNPNLQVFELDQSGAMWLGGGWSTAASLNITNGSGNTLTINQGVVKTSAGDLQLLAGSDQPYRRVWISRGVLRHGNFANTSQPSASGAGAGAEYYDTTLGKVLVSNGTTWNSQGVVTAGKATLAAGTVSIANTAVTANTIIRHSRQAAGGTLGELSIALTAGTGFAINSSSNTDTSTVYWEVVSY